LHRQEESILNKLYNMPCEDVYVNFDELWDMCYLLKYKNIKRGKRG
jgi:hypothetical protein